ncbi:MAG: hypothetical protein R2836_06835 [Chitinophagales bacterium]
MILQLIVVLLYMLQIGVEVNANNITINGTIDGNGRRCSRWWWW